jgi:hypothetical protein
MADRDTVVKEIMTKLGRTIAAPNLKSVVVTKPCNVPLIDFVNNAQTLVVWVNDTSGTIRFGKFRRRENKKEVPANPGTRGGHNGHLFLLVARDLKTGEYPYEMFCKVGGTETPCHGNSDPELIVR